MNHRVGAWVVASVAGLAASAHGQLATGLVRQGDVMPDQTTITGVTAAAANNTGGFAFMLSATSTIGSANHMWGSADGSNSGVFLSRGVYAGYTQTSWESSAFGLSDAGAVVYSSTLEGGGDSMWLEIAPLAVDGEPSPVSGMFWVFASRPKMAMGAGVPYWGSGISTAPGGTTTNRGLFKGNPATLVHLGGDVVPGLPSPLDTAESYFNAKYSSDGAHYLVPVRMETGSTSNDGTVILDGQGLLIDGALALEATPVPVAAGGTGGELWQNFDAGAINNAGDYLLTGDTNASTGVDDFLLMNGVMLLRPGSVLPDGQTVTGSTGEPVINNDGDWGIVWSSTDGAVTREVIIFNGEVIVREGDPVDLDGDGQADPGATISDLTGITGVAFGDRDALGNVSVYFAGDVDTLGTSTTSDDTAAGMRIVVEVGGPSCYANCDNSTQDPVLNVADFGCFLQRFAAGDAYANCDGSTQEPVLNVADFGCFLQSFAAGCR